MVKLKIDLLLEQLFRYVTLKSRLLGQTVVIISRTVIFLTFKV